MAMDTILTGGTSGNKAEVTGGNAQVNLPYDTTAGVAVGGGYSAAGFAAIIGEADSGSVTGTREVRALEVTSDFRARTGTDSTMFNEGFPGAALNSTIWQAPVTTSTVSVSGNFLTLNNGASLASGSVAQVRTYRHFPSLVTFPLYVTMQLQFSALPPAGQVHEWGPFIASGTAAPTDGSFFRINAAGALMAVLSSAGAETTQVITDFTTKIGVGVTKQSLITLGTNVVDFWLDNIKVAQIQRPAATGSTTGSANLPITFRSYNSALVTGTACLMKVGAVNVTMGEMAGNKPWSHIQSGAGAMLAQGQTGGTLGSTALYSNSLAVGAGAAATNTTAALGVGLGGQFTLLPTLVAGTDGIISSYQLPVGTAAIPGRTAYITGVRIHGMVTTALTGGPVLGAFSLAFGHNAVSLATTTTATTKAPVRQTLGFQVYGAAAAVGAIATPLTLTFLDGPKVVQPGEFVQIVMKNLGTVTTLGTITFLIDFDGYWE